MGQNKKRKEKTRLEPYFFNKFFFLEEGGWSSITTEKLEVSSSAPYPTGTNANLCATMLKLSLPTAADLAPMQPRHCFRATSFYSKATILGGPFNNQRAKILLDRPLAISKSPTLYGLCCGNCRRPLFLFLLNFHLYYAKSPYNLLILNGNLIFQEEKKKTAAAILMSFIIP